MATARIASIPATTLFKNSGGNALYIPPNQAVAVANPYSGWVQIPTTATDIGDIAAAEFLWYLPATNPLLIASGETAYFYRRFTVSFAALTAVTTPITPAVSIVADNAFLGRINIIPSLGGANITNLYDGVFTPSQSLYQTTPYTWQTITTPPVTPSNLLLGETSVTVEFELEVMNYMASPLGNPQNPAGFEYSVSISGFPAGSTFTNANNSNPVSPLP
ncbi:MULTISPECIES: hypothetical protein [Clostridium]|uniref:hypothetical protein n=1 Tax=Clostridium TaxID=1485 RepID=UPI0008253813|nr:MULTISPECIES: hypothetical protein [Clostridium]PJI08771.1 hypothetical protein CUB90_13235 [Clostridium sp. CT7]